MKRSLLVLTAAAVVLTPLAATAAPAKGKATTRTLTYEYSGAQAFGADGVGSGSTENGCQVVDGCWDFSTVKGEKTVEITASQPGAGFQVFFDDAYADNVMLFCGSGKIGVSPRTAHVISVRTSLHGCPGAPTSGTLKAVITGTR